MLDTGIEHGHRGQVPGPPQVFRRGHVIGIAECLMRSPASMVAPDFGATAGDHDLVQAGTDVDLAADYRRAPGWFPLPAWVVSGSSGSAARAAVVAAVRE